MHISDLKAKFKNQWVLGRVVETDEHGQAVEVEPLAHGKTRQTIDAKLKQLPDKHITVIYTGKPKVRI